MVAAASERLGPKVHIEYGSPIELPADSPDLIRLIKSGATLERKSTVDGTIIIGDNDHVFISNYRPEASSARRSYAARVGIVIRGAEARQLFAQGTNVALG